METIAKPFGRLMLLLYNWCGNYGLAVILFALVVKLIMLPFQLKSTKGMMRMSRMTPRLKELEKKFGNDRARYQQEMQKLYREEGVSPMSGCLWSLLPFPILIALYRAIRYPLTTMMGVDAALLTSGGAIFEKLQNLGYLLTNYSTSRSATVYEQIFQSQFITEHFSDFQGITDKLQQIYYNFLGLNLGSTPDYRFWAWDKVDWAHIGLFLIPIVSAVLSWLSMKVTSTANVQTQENNQQKSMTLMMPLMSLWICFTMPAVMGIYWIAQSLFATIQSLVLNRIFNRQLDIEDADRIEREKARAAELEAKREETERLKAEGATVENKNTSKRNKKAVAAQKEIERKAAEARAEKARRRAANGIEELPESQVGDRRFARGRAYVKDRFTNPDGAEERTLAAAAASEEYEKQYGIQEPDETSADLAAFPVEEAGAEELDTAVEESPAEEVLEDVPAEEDFEEQEMDELSDVMPADEAEDAFGAE